MKTMQGIQTSPRILLVEDEPSLREGLLFNLEAESYFVQCEENAESAEIRIDQSPGFDLWIFDVMLPKKSGTELLRELRDKKNYTPTLILTAKGRTQDILEGFQAGADDYVTKPFDLSLFLARVKGLIRRKTWSSTQITDNAIADKIEFDGRIIDFNRQVLSFGMQQTPLTTMETQVLRYLFDNQGKTVSRKTLLKSVWNLHTDTDTRAIDNFMVRIRRVLQDNPHNPKYLKTVRGIGYRLEI